MTDMQQSPLQQVEYWLRTPQENENLEFKEAKNSIDFSRLLEYCVAIGNEGGGSLVLGMTDKLPRSIVGTKAIPNTVKTSEQVRERTGFRVDIKEITHPDGRIVEVCIPSRRTNELVFGPKPFEGMDRDDRIRATYQHAALKRVMDEYMTNQSLRDRFKLPAAKSATVSQIIAATLEAGLIKADKSVGDSQRLRRYLPYWA
ncbi:MAG TPA: putative DNA binding domain-containing protein [Phycisphaerae bacterium]|nr:putative DNA binding domain-containing protein [Phycisphaerae bacterium]